MTSEHRSFSLRARLISTLAASVAGSLLVAGCGIGGTLAGPASNATPLTTSFEGKINGGPNPVQGATVKIYTTGLTGGANGGYGVATFAQEANTAPGGSPGQDTGPDGSFHFAGGYSCPAGQFLYIVSSGGDTGAGVNPKAILVAALGRCEDLFSGSTFTGGFIYMNEATTVAAAYALGNFTNIVGEGVTAQILIGAPDANNASVGCIANGTTCPVTAAAGLRHAFENATNLVNPFSGAANSTLPGNTKARVPLQLINSIADTTVACVNSDGTNNSCLTLFAATGTNPASGNTFQALVNLAKNPTLAGSGVSPAQFLAAATPQTNFYQPFLTTAPADYSISINYPRLSGQATGTQGLTYPYSGTLDINDNYYIGNYDSTAQAVSNAASFNSNGTLVSFTPDSITSITANGASVDAIGNLYLVGNTPSTTTNAVAKYVIDSTTGTISPTPNIFSIGVQNLLSSAVDAHNNVWLGGNDPNSNINEVLAGQTTVAFSRRTTNGVGNIAVDPDQNVWLTNINTHTAIAVLGNTGSVTVPSYSPSHYQLTYINGINPSGISFVAGSGLSPFEAYVSNSGTKPALSHIVPTVVGNEVTGIRGMGRTPTGLSGPFSNQTDGAGLIWAADSTDVSVFVPGQTTVTTLVPCTVSTFTSNTACDSTPYSGVQSLSIDSAGSIWFLSSGTGTVNELIGAATPAWPLLSLGQLGEPGAVISE